MKAQIPKKNPAAPITPPVQAVPAEKPVSGEGPIPKTRPGRLEGVIGLCRRARKLVCGVDQTCEGIRSGNTLLALIACDCSANSLKRLKNCCTYYETENIVIPIPMTVLASAVGKGGECGAVGINDEGFAAAIKKAVSAEEKAAPAKNETVQKAEGIAGGSAKKAAEKPADGKNGKDEKAGKAEKVEKAGKTGKDGTVRKKPQDKDSDRTKQQNRSGKPKKQSEVKTEGRGGRSAARSAPSPLHSAERAPVKKSRKG